MLTAAETALKEDKFIRGALPSAANSQLEFLIIGPSADGAAAASAAAVAASEDSAKKLSSDSVQLLQLSFFF